MIVVIISAAGSAEVDDSRTIESPGPEIVRFELNPPARNSGGGMAGGR
jgi:hypothetical protein